MLQESPWGQTPTVAASTHFHLGPSVPFSPQQGLGFSWSWLPSAIRIKSQLLDYPKVPQ